jgi:hypothetical protein
MNPSPRRKSSQDLLVTHMIRTGIPQVKTFAAQEEHHLASFPALAVRRPRARQGQKPAITLIPAELNAPVNTRSNAPCPR